MNKFRYIKFIENIVNIKRIYCGYKKLKSTGKLFVNTRGVSNDILSFLIRKNGYNNLDFDGVLGIKNEQEANEIIDEICKNGYFVFSKKLSGDALESIYNYAKRTPCTYLLVDDNNINFSQNHILFDEEHVLSPRYNFSQQQIIDFPVLQNLIFDKSILFIAQKYLKTKPILDLFSMWWSVPFNGLGKSNAAQMYHFDLDRIKFLKFFFYITDVDTDTGPHCYVLASHKKIHPSLKRDGRYTDDDVTRAFGEKNIVELVGEAGTIIVADTRGLHKGKELTKGKRLIFQIEFSNSMFGQYYLPCVKPNLDSECETMYKKYNETYKHNIH